MAITEKWNKIENVNMVLLLYYCSTLWQSLEGIGYKRARCISIFEGTI
jgi:hypothetical protein